MTHTVSGNVKTVTDANGTYDTNGNLTFKNDPRTGIDATLVYDELNRPTSKTYSGGTPPVTWTYDDAAASNSTGRLTAVSTSVSTTKTTSYDALGRVTASEQIIEDPLQPGTDRTYAFLYTYNRDGSLKQQTNPSGRVLTFTYDNAGRIANAAGQIGAEPVTNYASSFGYAPHGAVSQLKFNNGLWEHSNFNNRLQPTQIGLGMTQGGTNKLKLNFTYGTTNNNSNVLTQTITPPGITALTQTYTYDPLNRIATAGESNGTTTWSRTYGYDPYGNRAVIGWSGISLLAVTPKLLTDFSTASNRITMANTAYDPAGNLITTHLNEALVYDAENRQTSYTGGSSSGTYFYDGNGNRVKKVSTESGTTTTQIFVYDAFGKLAAEYSDRAPQSPGTHYRTIDHLGSTRLVTDENQADKARYDLLPFGEEIFAGVGGRSGAIGYGSSLDHRHKFTGKERDSESGMDYFGARYFSASLGRFTSADAPFADQYASSPQSWNLYGYVRNNPLRFIDPSGNACVVRNDRSTFDDDSGGQTCAEVDADPVGGESTTTSATVPLTDLPGQFFVGFGEFFLNGQPQGAAVMGNALAVGAGLELVFLGTSSANLAVVAASRAGDDFLRLAAPRIARIVQGAKLTKPGRGFSASSDLREGRRFRSSYEGFPIAQRDREDVGPGAGESTRRWIKGSPTKLQQRHSTHARDPACHRGSDKNPVQLMTPITEPLEVEEYRKLVGAMMLTQEEACEFNANWISERGWKVVPVESMARLPQPDIPRLASALKPGSSHCVAVATEPLGDMPGYYLVSIDETDFLAVNRELGLFRFLLTDGGRSWAISCTEWYNLFAAQPALLEAMLGKSIDVAREEYVRFASDLAEKSDEPLLQVASHYASL